MVSTTKRTKRPPVSAPLPSDEKAGERAHPQSTADADPVAALLKEIDSILEIDFEMKTRQKLTDYLEDHLGSGITAGVIRGRAHSKVLEFADTAAQYFEDLAAEKPLGRKGPPYNMRLRDAMQGPAIRRFIERVTADPDVRDLPRFRYSGATADSIRLVGAVDERFDSSDLVLQFLSTARYEVPQEIRASYDDRLSRLKELQLERRVRFHNGDILRLRKFRFDSPDTVTEKKRIILQLELLSWYDFSVVLDYVQECRIKDMHDELNALIDVADVGAGDMRRTRLPNPVPVCLTLVSSDKCVLYTRRDAVSAAPGLLSTSITENIHLKKDMVEKDKDGKQSFQIFHTAERGIAEELSPSLTSHAGNLSLSFLGMSFNLDDLECSLLFLGEMAATRDEIQAMCNSEPGVDYSEGRCKWVSLTDETELSRLLGRKDWSHDGKASIIRALEYLRSRQPDKVVVSPRLL